ncbi:SAM-dependent methyltransferase [Streptosporangium oxazolinicum]|uniref:SAM-dependent methyltransferase n=1 Tax=Streptosporangium oxazolinicum TaxID=909287 RepID=A0ABP8BCB5_9ACTN
MTHPSDASQASAARMYDVMLGGEENFAADREAVKMLVAHFPTVPDACRANRGFLLRSARAMAEAGIDQFLDIGCGLPTPPNLHQVVRGIHPEARVVYVDNDLTVVTHNQSTVDNSGVLTIHGDLRRPQEILDHPRVRATLDFTRPIGVFTVAVWHFIVGDGEDAGNGGGTARDLMARLRDALAPGSYLGLTHACSDTMPEDEASAGLAVYGQTRNPVRLRTMREVGELFEGFELLEPGLVLAADWRPAADDPFPEHAFEVVAGLGRIPPR